ncbi:hypothetical protein GCM10010358_21980 [Streptomyces minutiscleroticus]|uniref:Uncharacterized protein n=1 Tax=Streptomyces minutiscleroticus TaxID=68238 RepID=A0A918KL35_9ACTN|nr:hypothetical protein GCM10010358_21980 [Streptomyces minutiscleroticus]
MYAAGAVAGGPVTEAVGEFGQTRRGALTGRKSAYGVAHPDHRVRRAAVQAGQQTGPPPREHLAPGVFGDLALEVGDPVGDAARITERAAPVGVRDRRDAGRELLQLAGVQIEPAVHRACRAAGGEGLDGHRRVVGEPPEPFGPRAVQPLERLVQGPCRIHGANAGRGATVP